MDHVASGMTNSAQSVDLRHFVASHRSWLKSLLTTCESGAFKLFSVEDGRQIDITPNHIERLKLAIAEHDQILTGLGPKAD